MVPRAQSRCQALWRSCLLLSVVAALALGGCASFHSGAPDHVEVDASISPHAVAYDDPVAEALVQKAHATAAHYASGPRPTAHAITTGHIERPYLLDTGDKLRIFVYGQPNLSRLYTVDHAGAIAFPLIGTVRARGLTTASLEGAIRSQLGRQYVRDPQVTIDIQQNRPFFILGEVRAPGQFPYVTGMTVETAVAIAGGYAERASERRMRVSRRLGGNTETIEATPDFELEPGDTVYVRERFF